MEPVTTRELRKSYGRREVLHGVDLRVPAGALYGFLGPNGAGKTTVIRILLGLLRASGGHARVLGKDAWSEGPELRAQVGYLPGDIRWYGGMTGRATLRFFDRVRRTDSRKEVMRLADAFHLDLGQKVRGYSRGMKQKLGLIQALMHKPQLLILDEPTVSLDPLVSETVYAELRTVADEGRTVLFSSHTLSEVDQLCDWVSIVRDGHLIEQSPIAELRARALRHVEIVFADDGVPERTPQGLSVARTEGSRMIATWSGPMTDLLTWLACTRLRDVTIAPPDLEDLFMTYYNAESAENAA